jgi:UDP-glucuronate 4-epimerase
MKILVTGAAGFIGFHLTRRLVADGHEVVGLDNVNDYYDVELKRRRLAELGVAVGERAAWTAPQSEAHAPFRFIRGDLQNAQALDTLLAEEGFDVVCNLAAQAGVRYSLTDPFAYTAANMDGFLSVLEACRAHPPAHLIYASTSSVYGLNQAMPFSPHHPADHPVSLYAASKKANEMMAHSYSHLFGLPTTGLRFFTVYGPWGRPDMALFKFTRAMLAGEPIEVYNRGEMARDFTYIDDLIEAVVRLIDVVPGGTPVEGDSLSPVAPCRIVNIGQGRPVPLMDYIAALEKALGIEAEKILLPMQPGDVPSTQASSALLQRLVGYVPTTPIDVGIPAFVRWYREHYGY